MTATAARATCASFSHRVRTAESWKSPQNRDFYGHRITYLGKTHCIKDRVLLDLTYGTAFSLNETGQYNMKEIVASSNVIVNVINSFHLQNV